MDGQGVTSFRLEIAGLIVSVAADEEAAMVPGDDYLPFVVEGSRAEPDLRLEFSSGRGRPRFALGERLFKASRAWDLHRCAEDRGQILRWAPTSSGSRRIEARFSPTYARGEIRMEPWVGALGLRGLPLVEIAFESRLARVSGGVLVHALGLDLEGRGVLLPGSSGRGKSTLSAAFGSGEVLSDERIALVPGRAGPEIHGTPWRGTANRACSVGVPLGAIAFLGPHEGPWGLRRLSTAEAFRRLVFHGFPPLWDRAGVQKVLEHVGAVAEQVVAYEIRFQQGEDVRPFLREVLASANLES